MNEKQLNIYNESIIILDTQMESTLLLFKRFIEEGQLTKKAKMIFNNRLSDIDTEKANCRYDYLLSIEALGECTVQSEVGTYGEV